MKTVEKTAAKKPELIETERKMLEFIAQTIDRHGYQPSMREIAKELGYASPGYIPKLVESVERKGYVSAQRGARAIVFNWREFV